MDAQRTTFVLTIAALLAGPALAAPPSESAPVRYSNTAPSKSSWTSAGPTAPPTISTPSNNSNNRYASPQATYPQATYPQNTYPQNTVPTNGNNGVRTAANTPQLTSGTTSYPAQSTNPFATQPAAPPANSNTSNNLAPPPWPTNSGTLSPPPTSSWDSSAPVTPVDRSVSTNPSPPPTNSSWTSIGTTVAAPPLLVPPLPSSTSSFPPFNSTSFNNGPAPATDSYRGDQPSYNSGQYSASQSSPPATNRPPAAPDNWAASFDGSPDNNRASIERTANTPARPVTTRDSDYPNSPRVSANQPDTRSTAAKPADSWIDDSWSRNSQTPTGAASTIGTPKGATVGSAPNATPFTQSANNAPPLSPPIIGPTGNNMNLNGTNPNAQQQQPLAVNGTKSTQTGTATGEPQSWTTLLGAILALAFSLAFNIYLGWSYMDARQKYQALVRRTADTFRRTKVAA